MPASPVIILHQPQMHENIGAAARAMKNFGLAELRLVSPRDGWMEGAPPEKAIAMASGADEILFQARCFFTLDDALGDLHKVYATTGITRDLVLRWLTPRAAMDAAMAFALDARWGLLFGPERAGLTNDDLARCAAVIAIPTSAFFSLNLAQAVNILCYEWFGAQGAQPNGELETGASRPATRAELFAFEDRLFAALEEGGFFTTEAQRPTMERNIRNSLQRGEWTEQEVRTWQGILTALATHKKRGRA